MNRQCAFRTPSGAPCQSPPLKDGQFCRMHEPSLAQEVQEARRLGGLRRKREATVSGAYDFNGLETVADIRRLVEVAVLDTLGMENSISRSRTLAYLAMVALKTLEVGDLERRIAELEMAVHGNRARQEPPAFDIEPPALTEGDKEEP